MEKHRKTFLSYSRLNKDFAVRLARELKSEGFDVWLDQLDIPAGARWDREVERALKECDIFMIILTPASIDSENVLDEIGYAIDTHKRILPVLLEKCDVPLRLRRLQYVDFTDKSFDDGVESAKDLLRQLISRPTMPRIVLSEDERKQLAQIDADLKKNEAEVSPAGQKPEEERVAKARVEAQRNPKQVTNIPDWQETEARSETGEKATPIEPLPVGVKAGPDSSGQAQKNSASRVILYGAGLVAVLAVVGVIFSLLPGRGGMNAPIATLTADAMSVAYATEAPVTEMPTEILMTEVSATETPAPTDALLQVFSDTFEDDSMGWETGSTDNDFWEGTRSVTNGYYLWDLTQIKEEDFVWRLAYPGSERVQNFDVSVDVRRFAGTLENACYGIYFRESLINGEYAYYQFLACDDQTYRVAYFDGEAWEYLQDWTDVDSIQPEDWNTLRVVGNGSEFEFYINSELVSQLSDSRLSRGEIGLTIGWYDSVPGQISFDNFQLSTE